MSLLPTENHNLIIQTCVEKEVPPCNIKINDRRGCKYTTFSAEKKASYSKKVNGGEDYKNYSVAQ